MHRPGAFPGTVNCVNVSCVIRTIIKVHRWLTMTVLSTSFWTTARRRAGTAAGSGTPRVALSLNVVATCGFIVTCYLHQLSAPRFGTSQIKSNSSQLGCITAADLSITSWLMQLGPSWPWCCILTSNNYQRLSVTILIASWTCHLIKHPSLLCSESDIKAIPSQSTPASLPCKPV